MNITPAYEGKKPYLFISYAHSNSEDVMPVVRELYDRKYRAWYDEGISPGSNWPKNIEDHLNGADGVLFFVSEIFNEREFCTLEAKYALQYGKEIYLLPLDGSRNPVLGSSGTAVTLDSLFDTLPQKYIGDGSGYGYELKRKLSINGWNLAISIAVTLITMLAVSVIGLNSGWFDSIVTTGEVPPSFTDIEYRAEPVDFDTPEMLPPLEVPDMDSIEWTITKTAIEENGKDYLLDRVVFDSIDSIECFYGISGLDELDQNNTLIYTISNFEATRLSFDNATDEVLYYLRYFPKLESLRITGGSVTSLEALAECPELRSVYVSRSMFPLKLPERSGFNIYIID